MGLVQGSGPTYPLSADLCKVGGPRGPFLGSPEELDWAAGDKGDAAYGGEDKTERTSAHFPCPQPTPVPLLGEGKVSASSWMSKCEQSQSQGCQGSACLEDFCGLPLWGTPHSCTSSSRPGRGLPDSGKKSQEQDLVSGRIKRGLPDDHPGSRNPYELSDFNRNTGTGNEGQVGREPLAQKTAFRASFSGGWKTDLATRIRSRSGSRHYPRH